MNSSTARSLPTARPLPEAPPTGRQLLIGIALCAGIGLAVALCSLLGAHSWYAALIKPKWAPQSWVFAPVQLVVFALTGVALAYLWASGAPEARKRVVLFWVWAQLALGVVWNVCFFALHAPGLAYVAIMVWWCALCALLWTGSRLSRTAFFMLVPLWVWVTFASSLTFAVLSFNVLKQQSAIMDADPRNRNSPADAPIIVKKK